MKCDEAQELITALVDNETSAVERSSIEGHLRDCQECRSTYQRELALKSEVRSLAARVRAPADLKEQISSDLRIPAGTAEPGERRQGWIWPVRPAFRPALVFALLLILFLPTLYLMRPTRPSIPSSALETHRKILEGSISFVRVESEEALKEQLTQSVGGSFAPMGYDLSAMSLQAVGGMVQEVEARKILVAVYEGDGPSLSCYTFIGAEEDIPTQAALFFDPEKKINFYTFSRNGVNGVFYRAGKVICILVSKMPMGDLLALARSKAQPS